MRRFGFLLGLLALPAAIHSAVARELGGLLDGRPVQLSTTLLRGGEYVSANQLAAVFEGSHEYDGLSGTLVFTRGDGVRVGIKAGDDRVVVDNRVHYTGDPSLREDSRIYVPFSVAQTFLFPRVRFAPSGVALNPPTPAAPDSAFPDGGSDAFPAPDWTPPPLEQPDPAAPEAPSAVIVLDPGETLFPEEAERHLLSESNLTLSICEKLAVMLRETPSFHVILTRNQLSTEPLTNEQRIGAANSNNATLFVSLHAGNQFSAETSRAAVFYMNQAVDEGGLEAGGSEEPRFDKLLPWERAYAPSVAGSFQLARRLAAELRPFFEMRGIIQIDDGPRPARLALLRGLTMPGVAIEIGNLAHPATTKHYASERIRAEMASALERAISSFLFERAGIAQTPELD